MAFEPGNKLAAKHGKWRANIERAITQDDGKRLRAAAEQVLDLAAAGEQWAIRELRETLDGKAPQAVIMSGDEDAGPVKIKATIEFVGREAATGGDDNSGRAVEPEHPDSQAT